MFPSRLSRRLTTTLVILVALDAKDCRYHRADNSVIRAQCSPPVSPTPLDYRALLLRGTYLGASTNTRAFLYSYSRWSNTTFLSCTLTMSSSSAEYRKPLCGWSLSQFVTGLYRGSVLWRATARRQPRIKLMYELPDPRHRLADGLRLRCSTEGKAPRKFTPILLPSQTMLSRAISCRWVVDNW